MSRETVSSDKLHQLMLKGRKYKLTKGQIIQTTEDRKVLNLIKSGFVKRYLITNDGSLGVQIIYGPGDIFPLTLMFRALFNQELYEGPEVFYYETMSPTELYTLDEATLVEAVKENPELYEDLLIEAGRRLHFTLHGLENLTLKNSYKRLAHQLAFYAREFGEKRARGWIIRMPVTHQDLADILSVTRETISTYIVQLREKGLIVTGHSIYVPNIDRLEKEAYS